MQSQRATGYWRATGPASAKPARRRQHWFDRALTGKRRERDEAIGRGSFAIATKLIAKLIAIGNKPIARPAHIAVSTHFQRKTNV
jgi:hypothetical protein